MVVIKIFNANDRDFNTAGNIIIEPLYCHEIKKKSLNGWYIDVEIPIKYKEYIEQDKLCVVKTKSKLKPQAFRIKDIEYTTNKIVFQARHVMFDAEDYFLLDVRPTNQNGLNALNYINQRTDIVSPFTMYSNVENTNTAYFIRKNLLEAWSTIEEKWNGVFDADNWDISFLVSVGNDKGETIYYRKNLEDMKIIEDWSGVCTKLYPIGKDEMMLPNKYLESETQYDIPYTRTIKFDTQLSDEEQTEENLLNELETNAINYLQENCVPKVCYEINSNISQEMEIGDIIQVKHPLCNISTEVLEYEYDAILEKVIKLVFGNYSKDVKKKFKAVTESIESIKEAVNKQQTTINNQTNLINSLNKNGYVYIDENEILILDTIPKEKAKNVWRFGLGGIGFSSNGYEGPFEVAMTMDGQINANFITTGTLSVSRIEGLANFISETEKQISNIEIKQGEITSRVESIVDTKGEAEGKNIHIEDCAEEPLVDISLHGETSQKTRSGKNLCDDRFSSYAISSYGYKKIIDRSVSLTATLIDKDTSVDLSGVYFGFTGNGENANAGVAWLVQNGSKSSISTNLNLQYFSFFPANETTFNKIFSRYYIQIEEGEASTYEPYGASPSPDYPSKIENVEGNVEVKVEGKNRFDKTQGFKYSNISKDLWTITQVENGLRVASNYSSAGAPYARYIITNLSNYVGKVVRVKAKIVNNTNIGAYRLSLCNVNGGNPIQKVVTNVSEHTLSFIVDEIIEGQEYLALDLYSHKGTSAQSPNGYVDYTDIIITIDNEDMTYEPNKSQTAYFPLAEGQKLMEGSYLADDGIYNVRKQVVLDGTEPWVDLSYAYYSNKLNGLIKNITANDTEIRILCNCFNGESAYDGSREGLKGIYTINEQIYLRGFKAEFPTVNDLKLYIAEQYANGTPLIIEYELAEEEIVTYTKEQQKAWNKIKQLKTYKNITNITSDACAEIVYIRDNGLDIYETKPDAENKYIETTEKFAEQKITIDGIKSEVSSTQTTFGNKLTELTGKFDDYAPKSEIVTIQNSVQTLQTNTYTKTEINTKLTDGSVTKVLTTAGTFDENGLTIEKTNAKTKGNFNEKGITVTDATSGSSQELLFAGYDEELNETIVRSKNMTVEKYFVIGNTARQENYTNPVLGGKGVGVFIL